MSAIMFWVHMMRIQSKSQRCTQNGLSKIHGHGRSVSGI